MVWTFVVDDALPGCLRTTEVQRHAQSYSVWVLLIPVVLLTFLITASSASFPPKENLFWIKIIKIINQIAFDKITPSSIPFYFFHVPCSFSISPTSTFLSPCKYWLSDTDLITGFRRCSSQISLISASFCGQGGAYFFPQCSAQPSHLACRCPRYHFFPIMSLKQTATFLPM